jgi:membrane-associated phospholipid phosphatase
LYKFIITGGTFPSGHAGHVFLLFLLIPFAYTFSKYMMLLITVLISFFLIVSREHYTIDVVGGILLVFAVYKFMEYLKVETKYEKNIRE